MHRLINSCYSINMTTITIPKHIAQKGDLVIIPRSEYEALVRSSFKKQIDYIYEEPYKTDLKNRIKATKKESREGKLTKYNGKL